MALTPSTMLELGTRLPAFSLPNVDGTLVTDQDFPTSPLLVAFICNHCPYVQHIRSELARFGRDYQDKGLAMVAISSNDATAYPEDGPDAIRREAKRMGYTFPYLYDETQDVARAFHAACTPDFFLFDREHRLVYRGQFDGSRPGSGRPVTGADLRAAADTVLAGRSVPANQKPSVGCSIKWKGM